VFQITYQGGGAGDNVVLTAFRTATTTTLTSSANPAVVGQSVTFTALVVPAGTGAGRPAGTVTFLASGTPIGTAAVDLATGLASITSPAFGVGRTSVTAVYSPSTSQLQFSQSKPLTQFVSPAGTQTIVTAQAVRDRRGRLVAVDLVAQVPVTAPGSGVPTGTVSYFLNGNRRFRTKALTDGTAILRLKPGQALGKFLYVSYSGNGNFEPSVSRSQVVRRRRLKSSARPLR
jgi:hypothetical protein